MSTDLHAETDITTRQIIVAMPKAELHIHLDGCLRPATVADLAQQQQIDLALPPERVAELLVAPPTCESLMHVLAYFELPLQVMQTPDALERVTYELCQDLAAENLRYGEIRFGPSLHTLQGMTLSEVIEAVVRGWQAGSRDFGLVGGVILSALRHLPVTESMAVARAGLPFLGHGVVGFDLAGDEAGFPVMLHRDALLWAKQEGYGMTVHAGEAAGPESVRHAVQDIGVSRVGHGVRTGEDPAVLAEVRRSGVTLEMCPTSNVHTCAVPSLSHHPLARYYRGGVRVTLNSDNRTVSDTTVTRELQLGHDPIGLDLADLAAMTLTALEAGFAPAEQRHALMREYVDAFGALGVTPAIRPNASF